MDPWLIAAITVSVPALIHIALQRHRDEIQARHQLVVRMTAFAAALDALTTEIHGLPEFVSPRTRRWMDRLERSLPRIDYLVGRLAQVLWGREVRRSIDRLQVAVCELMPIAPPAVADQLALIFELLGDYEQAQLGDGRAGAGSKAQWLEQMQERRSAFGRLTREVAQDGSTRYA